MIDIDNFKMYNDIYGRDFGDNILRTTATILRKFWTKAAICADTAEMNLLLLLQIPGSII